MCIDLVMYSFLFSLSVKAKISAATCATVIFNSTFTSMSYFLTTP